MTHVISIRTTPDERRALVTVARLRQTQINRAFGVVLLKIPFLHDF